ncbi:hypothetical protein ASPTUDRAFT_648413 [Aspergillus tubingensis CBS 134.48]|uniref:Uncharacterized protein n=1 Tax=Aspergillus tubingensis (strain CBS 134.48) TaxID=767770 RepID=A0A1L9N4R2_ASPTC|nr:hypothetical protein ASPTUDRAFT_648413 [Aspergillus tubingensis CBS 134.48]
MKRNGEANIFLSATSLLVVSQSTRLYQIDCCSVMTLGVDPLTDLPKGSSGTRVKGSLPYPTLSIGVFTDHSPGMDEEGGVGWKTRNLNGVDNSGRERQRQ